MREIEEGVELIEPVAVPTVYVSGVARAFVAEGEVHILWEVVQPGVSGVERVANLRTVMPLSALDEGRRKVDAAKISARKMSV